MKNPVVNDWLADPESRVYDGRVYMYVTKSLTYEESVNLDLVTTDDLENFKVHYNILDMSTYNGAKKAIWAPTVIDKNGKYYIIFAANDIHSEDEIGGLYIGVCDNPEGPFRNVFEDGRPLLNKIYNNAQPIDAHLFRDGENIYLYYGGWRHMMVCVMNEEMNGFLPMEEPCYDGIAKEITPEGYMEAPYVMKIDGKYHLMYSAGAWTNDTYRVKAAVADGALDKFEFYADILKSNDMADGPGHNSAFYFNGEWYIAYHRRKKGDENHYHRQLCIDKLEIKEGKIQPVIMTE